MYEVSDNATSVLDLTSCLMLLVIGTRTAYGTLSVAVLNIWNKLPADVLAVNSLPVFRRRLKTHLFTAAFGDK